MKSEIVPVRHIGVDVSKAKLDVYVPAMGEGLRPTTEEVDNAVKGFRKLRELARKATDLCVETVAKDEERDRLRKRFTEVGGVGDITAISILAGLPEIGTLPDEKLNRLVGIAPTMCKLLSLLNRIARDPSFKPTPEPASTKKRAKTGRKRKAS